MCGGDAPLEDGSPISRCDERLARSGLCRCAKALNTFTHRWRSASVPTSRSRLRSLLTTEKSRFCRSRSRALPKSTAEASPGTTSSSPTALRQPTLPVRSSRFTQ